MSAAIARAIITKRVRGAAATPIAPTSRRAVTGSTVPKSAVPTVTRQEQVNPGQIAICVIAIIIIILIDDFGRIGGAVERAHILMNTAYLITRHIISPLIAAQIIGVIGRACVNNFEV